MHTHATTEKSGSTSLISKKSKPFFSPAIIQTKLTIGPVDDPYEREADAMAERVMRMTDNDVIQTKSAPLTIQKKCMACEEEEEKLQRKEGDEDEELLQRKCAHCEEEGKNVHRKGSAINNVFGVTPSVHQTLQSKGESLDHTIRSFMESRFGYDFGKVQIHNDSLAHQSSYDINALAYTHGNHIVFAADQYQPSTFPGKQLLAHELTHVVQQGAVNFNNRLSRKNGEDEKPHLTRYEEIEQSIDTPGEFEVIENPFGISIYNFAINRYYLKTEHKTALKKIGKMLISGKSQSLSVKIVGNTDSTGTPAINNPLSVNRAKSVRNYLADMTGKKYNVEGEGEEMPVTTNETDTGRSRNRRVDILIDHPSIHIKPKPTEGLELPPAYSYIAPTEIYRDELINKKKKSCPWPWSCIDIHIPWIWPWFPIPECVKLAIECDEGVDPEACYEFYEKCIKSNRKHACPENVNLPSGNLDVYASWPILLLKEAFWMSMDFKHDPDNGCYCECGEYQQDVRGFFEIEYKDGKIERRPKALTPGVNLEENVFHEDGDGTADSQYGHRSHGGRLIDSGKMLFVDKFFPTQEYGCSYVGMDNPGVGTGIAQPDEVRRTWFLEFRGYPVDTCMLTGKRMPMAQYMSTWRVQGEITAPPPTPTIIPKGTKPGTGPGTGGAKAVRATATKAKTHPSKSYPSWYVGGIDPKATVGQEFDMAINFRVSGKSEIYTYEMHVKVIEPTTNDFITVVTSNDVDLNVAPQNESEIVIAAHKKIRLQRSVL